MNMISPFNRDAKEQQEDDALNSHIEIFEEKFWKFFSNYPQDCRKFFIKDIMDALDFSDPLFKLMGMDELDIAAYRWEMRKTDANKEKFLNLYLDL